jgi:hypothetical protein
MAGLLTWDEMEDPIYGTNNPSKNTNGK